MILLSLGVAYLQVREWLSQADGTVDSCTWMALQKTELFRPILHDVPLQAQYKAEADTCWIAATAMLTGKSQIDVAIETPAHLCQDGGLDNRSDEPDAEPKDFCEIHNLVYFSPRSWSPRGFRELVESGPVMLDSLDDVDGYSSPHGSSSHMVVAVGVRGDDSTGQTLTLRIKDPAPMNIGREFSITYVELCKRCPGLTYRCFQKGSERSSASWQV